MRAFGYVKPVVAGEYGGPSLFEFPDVEAALQDALVQAFATAPAAQSTSTLAEQAGRDTPERLAMKALYARMTELPPRLQMFMDGCPPELETRRHRIACRQLVMRNVLAIASGIDRTLYWNLAPEVPQPVDPYMLMHLLVAKLPMLGFRDGALAVRHPEANTFELLVRTFGHVERIDRLADASHRNPPSVQAFRVSRSHLAPVHVVWDRRDPFDGECQAPVAVTLDWPEGSARAVDVFGKPQAVEVVAGEMHVSVTDTPIFIDRG